MWSFTQEWARFTKSRTARHKLAKFLKEHGHLLPDHYRPPVSAEVLAGDLSNGQTRASDDCSTSSGSSNTKESNETVWLDVEGDDGPGSLAKLAQIIDRHGHNVKVGRASTRSPDFIAKFKFARDSTWVSSHRRWNEEPQQPTSCESQLNNETPFLDDR